MKERLQPIIETILKHGQVYITIPNTDVLHMYRAELVRQIANLGIPPDQIVRISKPIDPNYDCLIPTSAIMNLFNQLIFDKTGQYPKHRSISIDIDAIHGAVPYPFYSIDLPSSSSLSVSTL